MAIGMASGYSPRSIMCDHVNPVKIELESCSSRIICSMRSIMHVRQQRQAHAFLHHKSRQGGIGHGTPLRDMEIPPTHSGIGVPRAPRQPAGGKACAGCTGSRQKIDLGSFNLGCGIPAVFAILKPHERRYPVIFSRRTAMLLTLRMHGAMRVSIWHPVPLT